MLRFVLLWVCVLLAIPELGILKLIQTCMRELQSFYLWQHKQNFGSTLEGEKNTINICICVCYSFRAYALSYEKRLL